jgi:hypothetical protein
MKFFVLRSGILIERSISLAAFSLSYDVSPLIIMIIIGYRSNIAIQTTTIYFTGDGSFLAITRTIAYVFSKNSSPRSLTLTSFEPISKRPNEVRKISLVCDPCVICALNIILKGFVSNKYTKN